MALPDSGNMQFVSNNYHDPSNWILVWTELRVPIGHESDQQRWVEYFQPLVQAAGHRKSMWARLRVSSENMILGTRWSHSLAYREFESSPSAQLFREQLANDGITFLACHEFHDDWHDWFQSLLPSNFIHLFWVYFKVPVTEEQKQRLRKGAGIRPPAILRPKPGERLQPRLPVKLWADRTEYLHGEEVQLLLWPHIWRDEEAARWRLIKSRHINSFGETKVDWFHGFLRDIGSMEVKEDCCHFKELPRL
ncbi:hypothetical protein F1880_008886 [Penicillium rolfsii]|nr:hypothetical protein F1880_008886 [Penicillium rolfsii]